MRLAFVVASLFGIGIPVYLVAWIVFPAEAGPAGEPGFGPAWRETGPLIGLALLGIGVLWLGGRLVPDGDLADVVWPLTLIGGGVAVLVVARRARRGRARTRSGTAGARRTDCTPRTGGDAAAHAAGEHRRDVECLGPDRRLADLASSGVASRARDARAARGRARRPRSFLAPLTVSVLFCLVGVVALLASLDVTSPDAEVVGAVALGIVGVALVVSAWVGRARGLVFLAVPLAIGLGIVAAIDTPIEGGIGDRDYRPATIAQLESEYRLAIGSMTIDLRDVPIRTGTTEITASVAIGELVVLVPNDVTVDVHAEAGIGQVSVFGEVDSGTAVERTDIERGGRAGAATGSAHRDRTGAGRAASRLDGGVAVKRHPFDAFAFCAGALFIALAIGFLLNGIDASDLDTGWIWPLALVVLGLAGVLSTVGRRPRDEAGDESDIGTDADASDRSSTK